MSKVALNGKYAAYPEYKDSGVEWLDEIPSHWRCTRLKRYCKVTDGSHHSPKIETDGYPFISVTDVGVNSINFSDAKRISTKDYGRLVREGCKPSIGDVLLTKDGTIGRACIVKEGMPDFVILSSLGLLTPKENLLNSYLYYYLVSGINVDQMNSMIHGSALRRMTISKIDDLIIVLPSYDEQTQIANFLDHETAKIDTLIEKQQQLIKLLKEKRQAVISHAVTKGLNPQAPMKNSGVEWLGEVPEHWVVKRLKHISPKVGVGLVINPSTYTKDEGTYFIFGGDVKEYGFDLTKTRKISQKDSDQLKASQLHHRDLVSIRVGYPGITAVVPEHLEGSNCASIIIIRRGEFDSDWLCAAMNIWVGRQQVDLASYGAAQKQFNVSDAIEFIFPVPPEEEQKKIASFVQSTLDKFTLLADQAQKQIELLKERRTALISAAITGKIDVRNWHAPDPEVQQQEAGL
ncbi:MULTISPECIES: restriction endonuclease subunit S [Vibrio]|uniref:restriction endonuclease subunit S n=1 Tax=Vibrio TaxID=662 RepID=UPI001F350B5E|nr:MULTISPECIES: restriction endonuclease subunit S [Vibrio]MCE9822609.1 restriction endonuclease subunit S [Vibrio alginolyticus]MDW1541410.1 restriction endonuclease subunit S [Vibrio sp. YT-17]